MSISVMNKKPSISFSTSTLIEISVLIVSTLNKFEISPKWLIGFRDAVWCFILNIRKEKIEIK